VPKVEPAGGAVTTAPKGVAATETSEVPAGICVVTRVRSAQMFELRSTASSW
jgi:hypothetical protein